MSNPIPPIFPVPDGDSDDNPVTRVFDGEEILDPDVDDNQVDSAEADRIASIDEDGEDHS